MDNRADFHHFDNKGHPRSVYDFKIFEYISGKGGLFVLGGTPYIYRDGVYIMDDAGTSLKTEIRNLIYPELVTSTTIERVYKLFISDEGLRRKPSDLNNYPVQWINFKNGFYDPINKKMIPHDQKYLSLNQIPYEYDPKEKRKGNSMEEWLNFIAPNPDDREMLLEFMGLCMTRDTRQQKFLILYGPGGSGKSTLIRLLEAMIGTDNISNISLKELSQRFASYGLMGKLLNSCADLETEALTDTSVIKKVLGEDTLRAEKKGCDAISFHSYAKLIFSANELPIAIGEKTNGFFRRLLILKMDKQPDQVKTDLLDNLKEEMDYLIQTCIEALGRMYEQGKILESENSKKNTRKLRGDSDPVMAWLDDKNVCPIDDKTTKTEQGTLYKSYSKYCAEQGIKLSSRQRFYRSLESKNYLRKKTNGGYIYFYGISLGDSSSSSG